MKTGYLSDCTVGEVTCFIPRRFHLGRFGAGPNAAPTLSFEPCWCFVRLDASIGAALGPASTRPQRSRSSPVGVSCDLMLPLGPLWGRPQRGPSALVRALLVFQRFGADGDSKLYNTIIGVSAPTDGRTVPRHNPQSNKILVRFVSQVPRGYS